MRLFAATVLATATFGMTTAALAKPHADLKLLTTSGTEFLFQVTVDEPGRSPQTRLESWRIAEVEEQGGAQRLFVVITEETREGLRDTQVEHGVDGPKFYDLAWLSRDRPSPRFDKEELPERLPLFDVSKAKPEATVVRYPDNPLAYVRYVRLKEFTGKDGKAYKDVIHATRNRGDTEPVDDWWFSPKDGLIQVQTKLPAIGGGATIRWVRTDKKPTPSAIDDQ